MTVKTKVPISELKIGDVVILENSDGSIYPSAFSHMLVADVADGQIRFIRPLLVMPNKPEDAPKLVAVFPTSQGFVSMFYEDFLAYADHKGLFYTVVDNIKY